MSSDVMQSYFYFSQELVAKTGNPSWLLANPHAQHYGYVDFSIKPGSYHSAPKAQKEMIAEKAAELFNPHDGMMYGIGVCGARGTKGGVQVTSGMPLDMMFMLLSAKKIQDAAKSPEGEAKPVYCFLGDEIARGNSSVANCPETQGHIDVMTDFYSRAISKMAEALGIENHNVVTGQDYRDHPMYAKAREVAYAMSPEELGLPEFSKGKGDYDYYRDQVATVWTLRHEYGIHTKVSWFVAPDSIDETSFDIAQYHFDQRMNEICADAAMKPMNFVATRSGTTWHRDTHGKPQIHASPYYALEHQGGAGSRFMLWPEQSVVESFLPMVAECGGCNKRQEGFRTKTVVKDGVETVEQIPYKPNPVCDGLPTDPVMLSAFRVIENMTRYFHDVVPQGGFTTDGMQAQVDQVLAHYNLGPEFARVAEICVRMDNGLQKTFAPLLAEAAAEVGPDLDKSFGFAPGTAKPAAAFNPAVPANDPGHAGRDQRTVAPALVPAFAR